jgi:hypothetical protein
MCTHLLILSVQDFPENHLHLQKLGTQLAPWNLLPILQEVLDSPAFVVINMDALERLLNFKFLFTTLMSSNFGFGL